MTNDNARRFAADWAAAWNRRDIETVLAHFHDDVVFTSPTAQAVMGVPTVRGKAALRDYWTRAITQISSLRFTVDDVLWDPERRTLAILYTSETNGKMRRVSENLWFDATGLVSASEVFHGVAS